MVLEARNKSVWGERIKILTLKQRLSIALAQVKQGNTWKLAKWNLLSYIFWFREKEVSKKLYSNCNNTTNYNNYNNTKCILHLWILETENF